MTARIEIRLKRIYSSWRWLVGQLPAPGAQARWIDFIWEADGTTNAGHRVMRLPANFAMVALECYPFVTWQPVGLEESKRKFSWARANFSILPVNSCSIDQKSGEIGTAQADLQPISFKSDRLLVSR